MGTIQCDIEKDDLYLQGLEKGELKAHRELATACLKRGLPLMRTAAITSLRIEEAQN
jgi:hypothetical protein